MAQSTFSSITKRIILKVYQDIAHKDPLNLSDSVLYSDMADFIIVGGGTAGCVLASRLRQQKLGASIILIEAGPDVSGHDYIQTPAEAASLYFSDLDWTYFTAPQAHLDNKPRYNCAIKGLSGGTIINTGMYIYPWEEFILRVNYL